MWHHANNKVSISKWSTDMLYRKPLYVIIVCVWDVTEKVLKIELRFRLFIRHTLKIQFKDEYKRDEVTFK